MSIVKMCLKLGQWTTHGSDRIPWNGTGEECKGERDTETEHSVQLGSSGWGWKDGTDLGYPRAFRLRLFRVRLGPIVSQLL